MKVFAGEQAFLGACPIINDEGIFVGGHRVIRFGMGGVGLGAQERRNPLPPGRYWVDVFTPQEAAFRAWLSRNKASVAVTTTEEFAPIDNHPGRVWRLFEVGAPVTWEGPGFPTIAGAAVQASEDVVQRPDPEMDPTDKLTDFFGGDSTAKTAFWVIGAVVAVVVGGVIIARYAIPAAPTPAPAPYA